MKSSQFFAANLLVRLNVKVSEQEIKHDSMSANPPNKGQRIVAWIVEEQLKGMNHNGHKLSHLQDRQPFLPPQIFLHVWTHCCEHVVKVHNDVNESVDKSKERAVSAGHKFNSPPN